MYCLTYGYSVALGVISKKVFVVPLVEPVGEKLDVGALLPLTKKYILPGSVISSDGCGAYHKLNEHGFPHYMINLSENFVDPEIAWYSLESRL